MSLEIMENISLWGYDYCIDGDRMWFFHGLINALFEADLNTGNVTYLTSVADEEMCKRELFSGVFYYKDTILLFPGQGSTNSGVVIYDLATKKTERLDLKEIKDIEEMYCWAGYLYLKPIYACDPILKFDYKNRKVVKKIFFSTGIIEQGKEVFNHEACVVNGKMIGVLWPLNICYYIDLETMDLVTKRYDFNEKIHTLKSDGEYVYLHGHGNSYIYKVSLYDGHVIEKMDVCDELFRINGGVNEKILITLNELNSNFIIDFHTRKVTSIKLANIEGNNSNEWNNCKLKKTTSLFGFKRYCSYIFVFNDDLEIESTILLKLDELDEDMIKKKIVKGNAGKVFREGKLLNLNDLINYS